MSEREKSAVGDGVALSTLAAGALAVVTSVDAEGPQGQRLLDLGFLPDTVVEVVRRAPLGDPIAFRVPLVDPDAFLSRWQGLVRPLFSRAGGLAACTLVLAAAISAVKHAPELAAADLLPLLRGR